MTAADRVRQFEEEFPEGFVGDVDTGLLMVDRHLPPRRRAMLTAMSELEAQFGPITWGLMTFRLRVTHGRYGIGRRVGANQTVEGRDRHGRAVVYRYRQKLYAEAGAREFRYDGGRWRPMSQLAEYEKTA